MTSREYMDKFKSELAEEKFHIINEHFVDGYFVFDMGKDSVCHFNIKEIKSWNFGAWFNYDENGQVSQVEIFTRHKDDMDKFKPSRSYFHQLSEVVDTKQDERYSEITGVWDIIGFCKLIKYHPIISYLVSYQCSFHCLSRFELLKYLRLKSDNMWYLLKEYIRNQSPINLTILKLVCIKSIVKFLDNERVIQKINIVDRNNDDYIISPRYDVSIIVGDKDVNSRVIGYIGRKVTGKRRYLPNAFIDFKSKEDKEGFSYGIYKEDYYNAYGLLAKIFGKKKYIDEMKSYEEN